MAGKCYKCSHELTDPNVQFCPWCGVKFAAKDAHYMADGRTITREDENAYLAAPPPKYKRSKAVYVAIGAIAVVAVLILVGAAGASTAKTDGTYDYEFMGVYKDGDTGQPIAGFNFAIRNDAKDPMDLSKVTITLIIDGKASQSRTLSAAWLYEGKVYQWGQEFYIDESDKQYPMSLSVTSETYKLTRGTVVFWRNQLKGGFKPTIPYQCTI